MSEAKDYTLGVLCAGRQAYLMAQSLFDAVPERMAMNGSNDFVVGHLGPWDVVITSLQDGIDIIHNIRRARKENQNISHLFVVQANHSQTRLSLEQIVTVADPLHKTVCADKCWLHLFFTRAPEGVQEEVDGWMILRLSGSSKQKCEKFLYRYQEAGSNAWLIYEHEAFQTLVMEMNRKQEEKDSSQKTEDSRALKATGFASPESALESKSRFRRAPAGLPTSKASVTSVQEFLPAVPPPPPNAEPDVEVTTQKTQSRSRLPYYRNEAPSLPSHPKPLVFYIFHISTLIAVLSISFGAGAFMIATAFSKTRGPSCVPRRETIGADDGFWVLLSQLFITLPSIYCTLYIAYFDKKPELGIAKFWFGILLAGSVVTAVSAAAVYTWSWKSAIVLSFASGFSQLLCLAQVAIAYRSGVRVDNHD